eukprot:TRINITY_DN8141_c0_g1_i1.p1 TRINITY_DN8141_c0_g1~~TRINITY_DN8141_c0_g1_i1.p1  ORF type:complete len:253 (+),score=15.76 TRINITY_DN8141_c0_g1_i1:3-761(+)
MVYSAHTSTAMVTVFNNTKVDFHVYLSMGAVHHYCNLLKPGEAFTIYPGPVWYTVGVVPSITNQDGTTNKYTDSENAKNIAKIAVPAIVGGVVAVGITVVSLGLSLGPLTGAVATMGSLTGATMLAESAFGVALSATGSLTAAIAAQGAAAAAAGFGETALAVGLILSQNPEMVEALSCHTKGIFCGGYHKIYYVSDNKNCAFMEQKSGKDLKKEKNLRFRKKNGLYNGENDYWSESDASYYPPNFIFDVEI